jgi:hypothetical protein
MLIGVHLGRRSRLASRSGSRANGGARRPSAEREVDALADAVRDGGTATG